MLAAGCWCGMVRAGWPLPPSPAQAAALRNLPLRSIPSLVPAFIPGLSDIVARPGASRSAFAPPIHMAMGGHGFREGTACRPPRQQLLPPASPTTAPACLANITHRLLTGKTRRQERKASHEDRTRKQVRKAGPEGRTGRQGRKAGWGRRMAKQCALRERCEILCIFAVLKY